MAIKDLFNPTVEQIDKTIEANVQNQTGARNETLMQKSFVAGIIKGLSGYIKLLFDKAEREIRYAIITKAMSGIFLDKIGAYIGLHRNQASRAQGSVIMQGTNNVEVPKGTVFGGDSVMYEGQVDAAIVSNQISITNINRAGTVVIANTAINHRLATGMIISVKGANEPEFNQEDIEITVISSTSFSYPVQSSAPSVATGDDIILQYSGVSIPVKANETGSKGNLAAGSVVRLSSSIEGANSEAIVAQGDISGGTDLEGDDSYRARIEYKLFYNSQDYTRQGLPNYLRQKYPKITRVKIINNYADVYAIKSILKSNPNVASDLQYDSHFRTVETYEPHGFNKAGQVFLEIDGASDHSLNVRSGIVSRVFDEYRFWIYVGNATYEDNTSTRMVIYPYFVGNTAIFFLKDNDINKYPTLEECKEVKEDIIENVLPFTSGATDNFVVKSPNKLPIVFEFSYISPNIYTIREAIKNNLMDFFKKRGAVGGRIAELEYKVIIQNTYDSLGNKVEDFKLTLPVGDIDPAIDEIPDLADSDIRFP